MEDVKNIEKELSSPEENPILREIEKMKEFENKKDHFREVTKMIKEE